MSALLIGGADTEDVVLAVEDAVLEAGGPDNYAIVAVELAGPGN